jgi:hypothetical protein
VKEETKKRLARVLDHYDAAHAQAETHAQDTQTAQDDLLQAFRQLCTTVIRPSMDAIGQVLHTRGHAYTIVEADGTPDAHGTPTEVRIAMYLLPWPAGAPSTPRVLEHCPHIAFTPDPYWRRIVVHTRTTTPTQRALSGGRGEYALSQVTAALVEQELVKVIEGMLETEQG